MTARTSWSVRAEDPPNRDVDPDSGRADHPLFSGAPGSPFDESRRLVREGNRDLPDLGADELEQAVARLSREIRTATRRDAAPWPVDSSGQEERRPDAAELAGPDRHGDSGRHWAEGERQPGSVLDLLDRLEARLNALSQRAGGRSAADSIHRSHAEPAAPVTAVRPAKSATTSETDPGRDLAVAEEPVGWRRGAHHESGVGAVREELDRLIRQIEGLDRNDRSLARAMEAVCTQLGELRDRLAERPAPGGEALERRYAQLLERIGRIEHLSERSAPPPDLWERLERLRHTVQELPGQAALTALEDRIADLAARIDAASGRGAGEEAIGRLESQLGELAGALAGLKEMEQARSRGIEARLSDLLSRIETGARGSDDIDLSALQERLDEILARVDGPPSSQFIDAIGSLEARLDALGRVVDERLTIEIDPLTRQLKELQGRLDQINRSVEERGDPVGMEPLNRRLQDIQQLLENSTAVAAPADHDLAERLKAIEDRLSGLSRGSLPQLEPLLRHLVSIAARLESAPAGELPASDRLRALTERLESLLETIGAEDVFAGFKEKIAKLGDALDTMNNAPALDEIADLRTEIALLRREFTSLPGAAAGAALEPLIKDLAGRLDRLPREGTLTMRDLEAQVDRIVRMMEGPVLERQSLLTIQESLRRIEEQLESGSRAALQSGVSAVHGLADGEGDSLNRLISGMSVELNVLKEAATSSQRNMRETLAAVHETLQSVIKRMPFTDGPEAIAGADRFSRPAAPSPTGVRRHAATRPVEPGFDPAAIPEMGLGALGRERPGASSHNEPRPSAGPVADPDLFDAGSHRVLGRLSSGELLKRATGGRADSFSPALDDVPDLPLEPGTEEPMISVLEKAPSSDTALFSRAERHKNHVPGRAEPTDHPSADNGFSADDFLMAARRAAQAAAIEAANAESATKTSRQAGGLNRFVGIIKTRRQSVLAVALALAVAFAALQFSKLPSAEEEGQVTPAPAAETSEAPPPEAPAPAATATDVTAPEASATDATATDVTVPDAPLTDLAPAPAGAPARAETKADEPLRPDSALAFGKPLAVPDSLQRKSQTLPAADSDNIVTAALPSQSVAARQSRPPEGIADEALSRAAAKGVPAAQFEVAARYAEGRGVPQDFENAAEWYRRAAEGGLAPAQYRLGSLYENGMGLAKDPAAAMEWYRRAAEAGNAMAMHNLAVLYAEGIEGSSELERAAEWFARAAERGVRDSQFNIGLLHARGVGVPQDLIEAYKWFAVAAQSGDSLAGARRDVLAESMSSEDLSKARAAARTFRPLIVDPAANMVEPPHGGWGNLEPAKVSLDSDLVRTVQELLAARGFDVGPSDGRLGPRTRSAVAQFQRQLGLAATGEIDANIVAALQQQTG